VTDRIALHVLGATVELDLTGLTSGERAAVAFAWSDAAIPAGGDGGAVSGAVGGDGGAVSGAVGPAATIRVRPEHDTTDLSRLLERLSQRVTLAAIEHQRGHLWMLHAAGLAFPDGRVVALIGPSGRGKTTASRMLGAHLGYVSDETVGIDAEGRVLPYRKPLSIIEDGRAPKAQRPPSSLGLQPLPDAELRLAAIVLLDRDPDGPDAPRIDTVDLGDALGELVAQSSYLIHMEAPLQRMAALAAQTGGLRRVTYREASTLLAPLRSLCERGGSRASRVSDASRGVLSERGGSRVSDASRGVLSERGGSRVSDAPRRVLSERGRSRHPGTDADLWFRTRFHDAIDLDDPDRVAVLQADAGETGMLRVIGGIAPVLWRTAEGATREALIHAALDAYGDPGGDPATLVDGALAELADGHLVERRAPRWAIRDDVAWTGEGDRVVVLSLADAAARPQVLEGSAATIWSALAAGAAPIDDLSARVAEDVGLDIAGLEADVAAFVLTLADEGLVGAE